MIDCYPQQSGTNALHQIVLLTVAGAISFLHFIEAYTYAEITFSPSEKEFILTEAPFPVIEMRMPVLEIRFPVVDLSFPVVEIKSPVLD